MELLTVFDKANKLPHDTAVEYEMLKQIIKVNDDSKGQYDRINSYIFSKIDEEDFYHSECKSVFKTLKNAFNEQGFISEFNIREIIGYYRQFNNYKNIKELRISSYINALNLLKQTRKSITYLADYISSIIKRNQAIDPDKITKCAQDIINNNKVQNENFKEIIEYIPDYRKYVEKLFENDGKIEGITTGIPALDEITNGFKEGELIILAGCTSVGKTSIGLHMALHAAKSLELHEYICFFSIEMTVNQLINRLITIEVNDTIKNIVKTKNRNLFIQGLSEISCLGIMIDSSGNANLDELRKKIVATCTQYKVKCIYIDYLQLLRKSTSSENRTFEVTEISRTLKHMAKEFSVPILALAQTSRKVDERQNKRPELSDLRESGSIEQDADIVLLLYRENYYKVEADNKLEINVAKNRTGVTGKVIVPYQTSTGKIL